MFINFILCLHPTANDRETLTHPMRLYKSVTKHKRKLWLATPFLGTSSSCKQVQSHVDTHGSSGGWVNGACDCFLSAWRHSVNICRLVLYKFLLPVRCDLEKGWKPVWCRERILAKRFIKRESVGRGGWSLAAPEIPVLSLLPFPTIILQARKPGSCCQNSWTKEFWLFPLPERL